MAKNTNINSKLTESNNSDASGVFVLVWLDHFGVHQRYFQSRRERDAYESKLRAENRKRSVDDEDYITKFLYEDRIPSDEVKRQKKQMEMLGQFFR